MNCIWILRNVGRDDARAQRGGRVKKNVIYDVPDYRPAARPYPLFFFEKKSPCDRFAVCRFGVILPTYSYFLKASFFVFSFIL